jgi:lipopolysaccharide transport system permease protein
MATVVDGYRWGLTGTPAPTLEMIGASTLAVVVAAWAGLRYFRRMERVFADVL